jgi:hypothetical protein
MSHYTTPLPVKSPAPRQTIDESKPCAYNVRRPRETLPWFADA